MKRSVSRSRAGRVWSIAVAMLVLALGASSPTMGQATFMDTSIDRATPRAPSSVCGNGLAEPGEGCDPGDPDMGIPPDLRGKTCESEAGLNEGELGCTSECKVDDSGCYCEAGQEFPATGQTTCSDRYGNVIDCTGTGHDGDIRAGASLSYTDNGDGTITDDNTGLMWEKKDDSEGIHDRGARYLWERAFSVFIDALNNTCEGDGEVRCDSDDLCGAGGQCGFAGYRDWRMPNIKELHSILNYGKLYPAVSDEFNNDCVSGCTLQQCSCTNPSGYMSSTSHAASTGRVWYVGFGFGLVDEYSKRYHYCVRAVRGGL